MSSSAPSQSPPLFQPRRTGPLVALGRAVAWHRRPLAVLAAVAAVLCLGVARSPAETSTAPVLVAAHDLEGGRALTVDDVRVAHYPAELAPADAVADPAELTGRMLIAGVGGGTPLGTRAVVAPRGVASGTGRAMVPIRLGDPAVVELLRVGDLVDILAASGDGSPARLIAAGARVLALPPTGDAGPLGVTPSGSGRLVLVEVSADDTGALVEAQSLDRLAVVLR